MTAWLIRYEAFPEKFAGSTAAYRTILDRGPLILDSWMQIEHEGLPIGYSHTWVDTNLKYDKTSYVLKNETILNFKMMGKEQWIIISVDATLDDQYSLQTFSAMISSTPYSTRITADRKKEGLFNVSLSSPMGERNFEVTIPRDVVLYSPMIEMTMKSLSPGQSMRLKTIDPLTLTVADLTIRAVRRENMVLEGESKMATLLNVSYQGMNVNTWIDADGMILRQETPFGWVIRASTQHEIFGQRRKSYETVDLLSSMSVPVHGHMSYTRAFQPWKTCLHGDFRDFNGLACLPLQKKGQRQFVEKQNENMTVITIHPQQPPGRVNSVKEEMPAEYHAWLASSPAIQSDNEKIRTLAKKIIGSETNSFIAAKLIYEWVYKNIVKQPAVSLPSALDVLDQLEGDCNEHTYLFVALARAAGLPACVNVGLLYSEAPRGMDKTEAAKGAFYYHAWPAVYVGEWIEMDPTLGLPFVDAFYIRLINGEIENQLKLLGVLGKVRVDVMEERSQESGVRSQKSGDWRQ
jgi:hypothetical protein